MELSISIAMYLLKSFFSFFLTGSARIAFVFNFGKFLRNILCWAYYVQDSKKQVCKVLHFVYTNTLPGTKVMLETNNELLPEVLRESYTSVS